MDNKPAANDSLLLEIDRVSVIRGTTRILDRISLTIPRGRNTAVLGPNGSGKSSLMKLLMRHFYPSIDSDGTQGEIRILGQEQWEVSKLRRQMGMVNAVLDLEFSQGRTGRMTVLDAVASGATSTQLVRFGPTVNQQLRARIERVLATVGMADQVDRQVGILSTGQRRRVMIARALVHAPALFVLDEPTTGLDMASQAVFLQLIDSIARQPNTTMLLVTHHVEEIPPSIDHVILLDQGRVVYDGPKIGALTQPLLTDLYGCPIDITRHASGWYSASADG